MSPGSTRAPGRDRPSDRPTTALCRLGAPGRVLLAISELGEPNNRARVLKWFGAGLALMGINTVLLFVFVERLSLPVLVATLLGAEACTLLRFLVNHYWVFRRRNPTLGACAHYHVATAGTSAVWWVTANMLTVLGVHYLLAGIIAVGGSTLLSLATSFFWIWHPDRDAE